jgi:hypothetical protein
MKHCSKFLFVGAAAVIVIAMTSAPSEAAKKKAQAAASCSPHQMCSTDCVGAGCYMKVCGHDGKMYHAFLTPICWQPHCPAACK